MNVKDKMTVLGRNTDREEKMDREEKKKGGRACEHVIDEGKK